MFIFLNPQVNFDGFGKITNYHSIISNESDHYYNYIDHYYSKSTEEFVNKLMRGGGVHGVERHYTKKIINVYFNLNNITLDKIN